MTAEKYTTYIDVRRRKWVVINLWYASLHSDVVVAVTLYRVDSHQELQYVEIDAWNKMLTEKQMIKL
jgi:hypothetical protein